MPMEPSSRSPSMRKCGCARLSRTSSRTNTGTERRRSRSRVGPNQRRPPPPRKPPPPNPPPPNPPPPKRSEKPPPPPKPPKPPPPERSQPPPPEPPPPPQRLSPSLRACDSLSPHEEAPDAFDQPLDECCCQPSPVFL